MKINSNQLEKRLMFLLLFRNNSAKSLSYKDDNKGYATKCVWGKITDLSQVVNLIKTLYYFSLDFEIFVVCATSGASLVTQMVKNLLAIQETLVQSMGQEGPLEKGMSAHSSILALRISCTEEPGGLPPMGSQRVLKTAFVVLITASPWIHFLCLLQGTTLSRFSFYRSLNTFTFLFYTHTFCNLIFHLSWIGANKVTQLVFQTHKVSLLAWPLQENRLYSTSYSAPLCEYLLSITNIIYFKLNPRSFRHSLLLLQTSNLTL